MLLIRMRTLIVACAACAFLGWCYSSGDSGPRPLSERPVAKWLSRAARAGLWVLWCAEPNPNPQPQFVHAPAPRGDDRREVNHGRGW